LRKILTGARCISSKRSVIAPGQVLSNDNATAYTFPGREV
jgi:hypothetical protein